MPATARRRLGQVGDQRIQLAVRAGPQRGAKPLVELLGEEPSFDRGLAKPFGYFVTLRVRCPQYRSSRHTLKRLAPRGCGHKGARR